MGAVVVRTFGGPERVEVVEAPIPVPGPGDLRVRVLAAAVHPVDTQVRLGAMVRWGAALPRDQVGLGSDVAGIVDAVGEGVSNVRVGDAVIGLRERLDEPLGTQADYVVIEAWAVAPVPHGADMQQAATLPLNATTADQALETLGLAPISGCW